MPRPHRRAPARKTSARRRTAGRGYAWPRERATTSRRGMPPRPAHGRILVGTASWTDPGFIADWYPEDLPAKERLPWYAEHLDLVELNSSFYAVPRQEQVAKWCEQTPDHFVFDIKLHRLLSRHSTDVKFLPRGLRQLAGKGAGKVAVTPRLETELTKALIDAVAPLIEVNKLGAFLLQLSPSFGPKHHALGELDHLLGQLDEYRVAVELRNRGWVEEDRRDETIAFFQARDVTLVNVDGPPGNHFMIMPELNVVTSRDLAYLRAHGRNTHGYVSGRSVQERFDWDYSDAELQEIAGRVLALSELTTDTHVIYNNNKSSYAPQAAQRFRRLVGQESHTPAATAG